MTRQHSTYRGLARRLVRRLRPAPERFAAAAAERFAAAAAVQSPGLLLQLQAADERAEEEPSDPSPVRGETGAALLLVAAVALALLWSNSPWQASYAAFWHAPIALTVGPWTLGADLRTWIDEGLMTLFFLVVGLEAKRERDLGELREGRRLTVPVLAALAGMATSAAVYVALTASGGGAAGWGVAISTDTALALGALTVAAGQSLDRLRVFMLTVLVVDDVAALLVISFVYPSRIDVAAVIVAAALLTLLLSIRAVAGRQFRMRGNSTAALTPLSVLIGIALWLALFESGFDPVVSGLLIGLLTNAYEPRTEGATSPITWSIILAYVVGKPLGIVIASCAAAKRRAVLSLSWFELRGTALSAGIGFTVSLLIASRAFDGALLDQAKVGILATALLAPALAVGALARLRRSDRTAPVRHGHRLAATSLCPAP
jgi:Na+/H+ antiporter NhaA